MQKKVLTAAIAGALAAPMAAQAVDFSISGHVNRAVMVLDSALADKAGTPNSAEVIDNGSSGTRVRIRGSSELMEGNSAGIYLEYAAAGSLTRRHSNIWFSGAFGTMTLGWGAQASNGSGRDMSGTFGTGVGQGKPTGMVLGDYFTSLDGGRSETVRYDTPSLGPVKVSASMSNDDIFSAAVRADTQTDAVAFGGTLSTLQKPNGDDSVVATFATKFSNGFTWSGAWGEQDLGTSGDAAAVAADSTAEVVVDGVTLTGNKAAVPAKTTRKGKPTYWQTRVGYVFGNNAVAIAYYNGEDIVNDDSESTAIGIGFIHNIPKAGVQIYAAAQNYEVEDKAAMFTTGNDKEDETVITIGSRISF